MKLLRHWAKASAPASLRGTSFPIWAWAGSAESLEDASNKAQAAAQRAAARLSGHERPDAYSYGERGLREEILEEIKGEDGRTVAALTRNGYGATVLNAERLFFADLDLPRLSLMDRLARLFGNKDAGPEERAILRLTGWLTRNPEWSFRVYRTPNGLRLMAPHYSSDPTSEETRRVLEELESDPLFTRLCRAQECFRARLTPKYYRLQLPRPPKSQFQETGCPSEEFTDWAKRYEEASRPYASCRYLKTLGHGNIDPGLACLVELHDARSGAFKDLPLA